MFNRKIRCKNNPKNSSTTKVGEDLPSIFSKSVVSLFKSTENKHDVYRGKNCLKQLCESLREHEMETTNFKQKTMT